MSDENPQPRLFVMEYLLKDDPYMPETLCRRKQREGSFLWSINRGGNTLNNDGEWEFEPMPSSRSDDYIRRNRYKTSDDAILVWLRVNA